MSEWDDIQEEIDADAAVAHAQECERRRAEDESIERSRKLLEQFRRDNAAFSTDQREFNERIRRR